MTVDPSAVTPSPESLANALAAFRALLGDEYVVVDETTLGDYATATFRADRVVPAVLRPGSIEEVQAILRIANEHIVPVYPISTGLNTGYGSRLPAKSGCVIMELKRLDAIVEYNAELGYVRVQPGVTQQMLFDFLVAQNAPFWIDVTGASPHHSMIGNIAERGFGHTAFSDHFAHVGGFKVVLPQGDLLRTGFGQYENAQAVDVYRWGVGPHYDGLFTQSNLGVIVEATIWLMPKPDYMQFFSCKVESDADLPKLIEALKPLRLDGTIKSAMHIGNDYKMIAAIQSYPFDVAKGATPLPKDVLDAKSKEWDCGPWNVSGALYGTRAEVRAARGRIKKALRGKVHRLMFMDELLLKLAETFAKPYQMITGTNLPELMKMLKPVFGMTKGEPSDGMLPSNYWRKPSMPEASVDLSPEQDRCGVMWIAPIAPNSGAHAEAIWHIVRDTMLTHGYEPAVSITMLTERTIDCVVNIAYDRDVEGQDEQAMACHDSMLEQFCAAGYYPYRLGIQTVGKMPPRTDAYETFMNGIRDQLDPKRILAPGRYLD
ncbi:FAD linked oxidase domain protein [gamma proteobacterium NOR5-3]|nr:FAD linked oxidase domain protein [gamma proteobacterium NOR5-3]